MKELELSPRLQAIADQVPSNSRLIDVGTDHGYLPVWLCLQGKIRSALATDLREGPLSRGRETAQSYAVAGMSFRCCDGLQSVQPEEGDVVSIAGMGGELIASILSAAPWTREALLILQPMSAVPALRQWLTQHGHQICQETVVAEGRKFYVVMTVQAGDVAPYTLGELWAGRQWRGQYAPHRAAYLRELIERRKRALAGMARGEIPNEGEMEAQKALIGQLENMLKEWIQWQP